MQSNNSIRAIKKSGIYFLLDENNKLKKYKPWLGKMFAFLYDRIVRKFDFPKKFNASMEEYYKILKKEFEHINSNSL